MIKVRRRRQEVLQPYPWLGVLAMSVLITIASPIAANASPDRWRTEGWAETDFSKSLVDWNEIMSGGPGKDGIPSIDKPKFQKARDERRIADQEAVIGLEINGDARAYPIQILMWHEIVNDTVGGVPVAVTYCPLCNAAIVFDRRTPKGTLTFGTTGKLRKSDLVMYDRQTQSWWQQFSGKAIVGALTGQKLRILPARLEAFSIFRKRHPEGRILVPNDRRFRAYGRNPYKGYDTSTAPFLFKGEFPKGINPMARVVVIRERESATAVTMELLREKHRITLAGVHLTWLKGQASALDHQTVAGGRDVGNVVAQIPGPDGKAKDVPFDITFAFVFHAFNPNVHIIKHCNDTGGNTRGTRPQIKIKCGQKTLR